MMTKALCAFSFIFSLSLAWGAGFAAPGNNTATLPVTNAVDIKRDALLQKQLQKALQNKGNDYVPRTEHLDVNGRPLYTNRLILEDSPYLLQHAHNPVDWYAWGPDAFVKAQLENKPVFLSIGYSTCHWCHVMEKESFENPAIANILNKHFIAIKVDRERRPDVDATYMTAVMLISGHGGWPMSSFLSPEGKTFYGATYLTPTDFTQLLQRINHLWQEERAEFLKQADDVAKAVANQSATRDEVSKLRVSAIENGVAHIMAAYDEMSGGYSQAPKFPNEPILDFLLNHVEHGADKDVLDSLQYTLVAMSRGGLYDQIGGGFHRYSTDNEWLVPHFEKMLYNQANLSRVYTRAFQLTHNSVFERVARNTLDYVLREMTATDGGFYSATDADSEGHEGLFFVWTPAQVSSALNESDAKLALELYGVTAKGNFEGHNILHLGQTLDAYATRHQLDPDKLLKRVARINRRLLKKRQERTPPLLDTKVITAWNGMMIIAFAQAGDSLAEPIYLKAAIRAAKFIWQHNRNDAGDLLRASLAGNASVSANQADYAYLAESFLMLFDVTHEEVWLQRAIKLSDIMLDQFWDKNNGGFYFGSEKSVLSAMGRIKDSSDGAMASGNSVALQVLQKLSRRTNNLEYGKYAQAMLSLFSSKLTRNASSLPYMLSAANDLFNGEAGAHLFAAHGAVAVDAQLGTDHEIILNLFIRPGWHINAHKPLQEYLIPTSLQLAADAKGWRIKHVNYPAATTRTLGFQPEPLALYEGQLKVKIILEKINPASSITIPPPIELRLQACSDSVCLSPETLRLLPSGFFTVARQSTL
ncbi:MAG: thioredoxin [Cellvibrionales bacterium]|nr:MAG: thioredoxin [Cellvibrionales bacterium]